MLWELPSGEHFHSIDPFRIYPLPFTDEFTCILSEKKDGTSFVACVVLLLAAVREISWIVPQTHPRCTESSSMLSGLLVLHLSKLRFNSLQDNAHVPRAPLEYRFRRT